MKAWFAAHIHDRRYVAAATVAATVIVAVGVFAGVALSRSSSTPPPAAPPSTPTKTATPSPTATATPDPSPTPIAHANILDGAPMTDAEWQARKDLLPVAVMFDNSPDAFPQTGLDKADLVYEAFVEGGITRFMAVFWGQEADYLEPVRSARTPFVVWVSELDALYGYAGEADTDNGADAGGQIQDWGIKALNALGGAGTGAYYRDSSRYAPHNLVTSTTALRNAATRAGYTGSPTVQSWLFRNPGDPPPTGSPAGGIEIDFEGERYANDVVQWKWDPATSSYLRFEFGGPHIDGKTNQQLHFTNVIVMTAAATVVDSSGHVLIDQIGSGPATVFFDGQAIKGTWKKVDRTSRTRFYDANGNEIPLERGPTFIEVIGLQSSLTVTATATALPPLPKYIPPPPSAPTEPDDTVPTPSASPSPTTAATTTATPSGSPAPASTTPSPSPGASSTARSSATPPPSSSASPGPAETATPSPAGPSTATVVSVTQSPAAPSTQPASATP